MWIETAHTIATPLYTAAITVAFCVSAILVMYLSAQDPETETAAYETRRSMLLLEAIRQQAEKLHDIDTVKPAVHTGVVTLRTDLEKQYWSDRFGIPPEALKAVVQHVGPMAPEIESYLEQAPAVPPPRRYSAPSLSTDELWPHDQRPEWLDRAVPVAMGVSGSAAINALMLVSAFS